MARCLVFGGNGFIGSHVVDHLVAQDHDVAVFGRFHDGRPLYQPEGVEMVQGDIRDQDAVCDALTGREIVYHLASSSSPATAELDPLGDIRASLETGVHLFQAAAERGVQHLYYASTGGAVYGDQQEPVVSEATVPQPFSPYAITKLAAERYLEYVRRTTGMDYTVLRLSNPYGPRHNPQRKQGVIPIFLRHVLHDEPVRVLGDGTMTRDYIYVEDLARMMVLPLVAGKSAEAVYNLGSGTPHTVNDIVAAIEVATGRTVRREYAPQPLSYVQSVVLDVSRFQDEFGPVDLVPLVEGVRRTWAHVEREG